MLSAETDRLGTTSPTCELSEVELQAQPEALEEELVRPGSSKSLALPSGMHELEFLPQAQPGKNLREAGSGGLQSGRRKLNVDSVHHLLSAQPKSHQFSLHRLCACSSMSLALGKSSHLNDPPVKCQASVSWKRTSTRERSQAFC